MAVPPSLTPILHVDMDAFFASVEVLDNPALGGLPVLVGGDGARGVVAAASYEARKFGCQSAQPMAVAKRLCPNAVVVRGRHGRYREISDQVFEIFKSFTPVVQPLSIDEAFLDLHGTERLHGSPIDVARRIRQRIGDETGLTASVGVAANKFLAKLASDLDKPDGLTVIGPDDVDRILPPLDISRLWGVGKVTAAKLNARGIHTFGHLRRLPMDALRRMFGSEAQRYYNLSRGIDHRTVTPDREAKSVSHEQTFDENLTDPAAVRRILAEQVEAVAARLRRSGRLARGVALKIRFGQFETIRRSATLPEPTDRTSDLLAAAQSIFDAWPFQPVRLIGMAAERLSNGDPQLPLFADPLQEKQTQLDAVSDRINAKFGKRAIGRGGA